MLADIRETHKKGGDTSACIAKYKARYKYIYVYNDIIFKILRRPYGKRHVQRRDTRMGQERKGVPESLGGHRRQPARRRLPGRVHRQLPMVHVPAGMHRHRRRA